MVVAGGWGVPHWLIPVQVVRGLGDDAVSVVDLNKAMMAMDWRGLLRDGLHFNAQGNALVHELLSAHVAQWAPELAPQALPPFFPTHIQQAAAWREQQHAVPPNAQRGDVAAELN